MPEVQIAEGCRAMPVVGLGTAAYPFVPELIKDAALEAMRVGYRHFDSASLYESEGPLGEAIREALELGIIASRGDLFVTSKLWCNDAHPDQVLPAIKRSLSNLQLEYLDLYLVHTPFSTIIKPGTRPFPINHQDLVPFDMKSVWEAMEECKTLGLTKAIGVSNFNHKRLEELLTTARIPPSVNQVEMNVAWQQKQLTEYCKSKGIHVTAYSPLGGSTAGIQKNKVRDSDTIRDIAVSKGKTVAQVSLRWLHEQGVSVVAKSFNKERMKQNIDIFDWELSDGECLKISEMPQRRTVTLTVMLANKEGYNPLPEHEL